MKLHINATRMELLKLRKRLSIATRGHKLLNDKLEGLMREFLSMIRKYKGLRMLVDKELPDIIKLFIIAQITSSKNRVKVALEQSKIMYKYNLKQRKLLNVTIPYFSGLINQPSEKKDSNPALYHRSTGTDSKSVINYSFLDTSSELDNAITRLRDFYPNIIKLAELEQSIRVVTKEIAKTRRRVNSLEFNIIPQMKEDLTFIRNKLDEMERSNISRIMKIKEILKS